MPNKRELMSGIIDPEKPKQKTEKKKEEKR